jgi:hypothetical protein
MNTPQSLKSISTAGANPTIAIYNAMTSRVHFDNKTIFWYLKKTL